MKRAAQILAVLLVAGCGGNDAERMARALDLPADVGGICGMADVLGREIGEIGNPRRGGCGIEDAVRVHAVAGVRLSRAPRLNCRTAIALRDWIRDDAQPAARANRTRIEELRVVAGYACRRRNNRPSGKLSEHARGNAVDIAGFTLADGTEISVLKDWSGRRHGKLMRRLHASACGPFGTVLGPKSDRFHQDHFHFDTAAYRSGPYCR